MSMSRYQAPEAMKKTAQNMFIICGHLQNPELYSTIWADAASSCDQGGLVATRDVENGEILSLIPVHAVGLKGTGRTKKHDFICFNNDLDGNFFRTSRRSAYQVHFPDTALFDNKLFIDISPGHPSIPGWIGHLASTNEDHANCKVVPLVPPLCALVATSAIAKGKALFQSRSRIATYILDNMRKRYSGEILELESYMAMAHLKDDDEDFKKTQGPPLMPFHAINRDYPGINTLNCDPDVIEVACFLSDDECDRLIAKARAALRPCVTKNPRTGAVEIDPDRTSTNANIPQAEVPSIVTKICCLANCDAGQLEIFQVLHYDKGQRFNLHTDGFHGPTTACGFENSGRLVTVFCYLNDVAVGGETRFPVLGLDVRPSKGKAVIHFPTTTGLEEDPRTEHEGVAAVDEKWLFVTWVWKNVRSDEIYAESNLPYLSKDLI